MSKKTVVQYGFAVMSATVLSISLAEYIQHGPLPFPEVTLVPIIIPIVCSYWCSGWLGSPVTWRFVFAGVSLALNLLILMPVLFNHKFKTRIAFISVQIAVLIAYVLISIPFSKIFARWMSV